LAMACGKECRRALMRRSVRLRAGWKKDRIWNPARAKAVRTCGVNGCNRPHRAKNMCAIHYKVALDRIRFMDPKRRELRRAYNREYARRRRAMTAHAWVKSSGTTDICGRCGCVRYWENAKTGAPGRNWPDGDTATHARWVRGRWVGWTNKDTKRPPRCDPTRPAPEWARKAIGMP